MPAHSGVAQKLYPCSGSQIPCSQMISMNINPPRLSEARKLAMLPGGEGADAEQGEAEHRLRTWVSMIPKTTRTAMPPKISASTFGTGPAHRVPPVGQQAVGDADQDEDQADGEGDVAEPVDLGRRAHAAVLELRVGHDGAEDADGYRDQEDQAPLDRGQHPAEHQARRTSRRWPPCC